MLDQGQGVGHHADAGGPDVEEPRGRLEHEAKVGAGTQVEGHVEGGRRRHAGERAGEAALDGPVQVPAQHPLDVLVGADDPGEGIRAREVLAVHEGDSGLEGRVVHEDHGRASGGLGQAVLQPRQAFLAHLAGLGARLHRVEGEQAHRQVLDSVVQERAVLGQVAGIGEGRAQAFPVVAVAGDQVDRRGQGSQQAPQLGIGAGVREVDEIARDQHRVRRGIEGGQAFDGGGQAARRVGHVVGEFALGLEVYVGDMGDDHDGGKVPRRRAPRSSPAGPIFRLVTVAAGATGGTVPTKTDTL